MSPTIICLRKEKSAVGKTSLRELHSSESRNSSKNMPRFSSNDMVHNHYLKEAKKKTQERGRNSRPSVMPSARSQRTVILPTKPRINDQKSRNWPASKSSFIPKITNRNKPEMQISVPKKLGRQIPTGHRYHSSSQSQKGRNSEVMVSEKTDISENQGFKVFSSDKQKQWTSDLSKFQNSEITPKQMNDLTLYDGNPSKEILLKLSLPDHRYKRRCCSLIPAELNSLPHAHTQATKRYYKHQDSRINKAQELNTKTSATLIFKIFLKDIKIIKTKIVKGDC
ncbi:hypothetical protein Tco_0133721 [Tanacetum coccineum]